MIPKINNTSKLLILSGFLISITGSTIFGIDWLELAGLSIVFVGFILSKKDFIEGGGDNGKYIYYTIIVIFVLLTFIRWFGSGELLNE
ncbi:MAG: hypothetical protein H7X99_01080 [Saprospiraceae bacterium]|nr:hypothetical protein [Saprospiraceae bacterium]